MSKFRTTELSDPEFESNNLRFITVKSAHLQGRGDICVFVPKDTQQADLPIAILLHGVYGSAWVWSQKAGVHITAQRLIDEGIIRPMILAMPSDGGWGDGSGYIEHHGMNFEKWIAEDVAEAVKTLIPQAIQSNKTFIAGLSMGGFGALRIGAKYAEKFCAISAHSAITAIAQMSLFVEEDVEQLRQHDPVDDDVFLTMLKNKDRLPPLRFDCGKDDLLIEFNRKLAAMLAEKNISHTYQEFEGGHQWSYWQEHIQNTLRFFDQCRS